MKTLACLYRDLVLTKCKLYAAAGDASLKLFNFEEETSAYQWKEKQFLTAESLLRRI